MLEELKISLSLIFYQNFPLIFTLICLPLWFKVFINNWLLNRINDTNYFLLFLNPFSQKAIFHGLNCIVTFYWKQDGVYPTTKKTVNYLSLIFGCLLFLFFIFINFFLVPKS